MAIFVESGIEELELKRRRRRIVPSRAQSPINVGVLIASCNQHRSSHFFGFGFGFAAMFLIRSYVDDEKQTKPKAVGQDSGALAARRILHQPVDESRGASVWSKKHGQFFFAGYSGEEEAACSSTSTQRIHTYKCCKKPQANALLKLRKKGRFIPQTKEASFGEDGADIRAATTARYLAVWTVREWHGCLRRISVSVDFHELCKNQVSVVPIAVDSATELWTLYAFAVSVTILRTYARVLSAGFRALDAQAMYGIFFLSSSHRTSTFKSTLIQPFPNAISQSGVDKYHPRIYIAMGLIGVSFFIVLATILLECRPFHHYWKTNPNPGNACHAAISKPLIWVSFVSNVSTDILLFMIPVPMLWRLLSRIRSTVARVQLPGALEKPLSQS
ncbi:hypothetical protein P154DRAFT_540696 [Amniculicola lignicola CBS 123094]|uniref:Rhodopsin domain-containing protein n=1 Tax=Amniculicola lignicola CBS 123094 TaxID=1392246 RepID=A0A6A5VUN2_9PLEO|nr:hypothetical protein P154DRAFT_540696 [Amniculicola lignicola CBS 123094]